MGEHLIEGLAPIRERRANVLAEPGYIEDVLASGTQRARERAAATLGEVRAAVGLP